MKTARYLVVAAMLGLGIAQQENYEGGKSTSHPLSTTPGTPSITQASSDRARAEQILADVRRTSYFIQNKGQWDSEVLYLCQLPGAHIWITRCGAVYDFFQWDAEKLRDRYSHDWLASGEEAPDVYRTGHVIQMELIGSRSDAHPTGIAPLAGYHNYIIGNDSTRWASFVPLYQEVRLRGIYEGIDIRYYLEEGRLRFDFVVEPGADPSQIRFRFHGQFDDMLAGDKSNQILLSTQLGDIAIADLRCYQHEQHIESHFVREGDAYQIALGPYNPALALVIDPLIYSTYLGSPGYDEVSDIVVDATGNAYITGWTTEYFGFPVTPGAYMTTLPWGWRPAFITKIYPGGNGFSDLIFSTYLAGGGGSTSSYSIAIDPLLNVYVGGTTLSPNFPTTTGAYSQTKNGLSDGFIAKLNPTGSNLLYCTYIGGSHVSSGFPYQTVRRIAVDVNGIIYAVGETRTTNFPTTPNAYDQTYNGGDWDVFFVKLNPAGQGTADLLYATFIGGSEEDRPNDIVIDATGTAYITGQTWSANFPTTSGAFATSRWGASDAFIVRIDPSQSGNAGLLYSSYFGGDGEDRGEALALDGNGRLYVSGRTGSGQFPTTPGCYNPTYGNYLNAFVSKFDLSLGGSAALLYSTYIGGMWSSESALGLAVDSDGRIYVAGSTWGGITPPGCGGPQLTPAGSREAYVAIIIPAGQGSQDLLYYTYHGGAMNEMSFFYLPNILALGPGNLIYLIGNTQAPATPAFPITPGAPQTSFAGPTCCLWQRQFDGFFSVFDPWTGSYPCPLPIRLLSFSADCEREGTVSIRWETAAETHADHFQIEHSTDMRAWQQIAMVSARYPIGGRYEYLHFGKAPRAFYRLRMVDTDGSYTFSSIVEVQTARCLSTEASLTVYPNPTTGAFTLYSSTGGEFMLLDAAGQVLRHYTLLPGEAHLCDEKLPAGIYFVRSISDNQVQKLVVSGE